MKSFFIIFGLLASVEGYISNKMPAEPDKCGDCLNPLVRVEAMVIEGDIPEHFKQYQVEFGLNWYSGWSFLQFKDANPCADLYYLLNLEGGVSRHGVKNGEAKYIVRPHVVISQKEGFAVVKRATGFKENGWQNIEDIVIPKLGNIQIYYDLVALKSQEIYDSGKWDIDWVSEPPEGTEYFFPDGNVEKDGQVYLPKDGILKGGSWAPTTLASQQICFENGDIGKTIREMETPIECEMKVDDKTNYPKYFNLTFSKFVNQRHKILPSQVKVAIKAQKGKILNGDKLGEWSIFNTIGGDISEIVRYTPPECKAGNEDVIEIAGVCQFHDGELTIGKSKFPMTLKNEHCQIWEASISYSFGYSGEYQLGGINATEKVDAFATRRYQQTIKGRLYAIPSDYYGEIRFQSDSTEVFFDDYYDGHISSYAMPENTLQYKAQGNFLAHINQKMPLEIRLDLPSNSAPPSRKNRYDFKFNFNASKQKLYIQYRQICDCSIPVLEPNCNRNKIVNIPYHLALKQYHPLLNEDPILNYDTSNTILKNTYVWYGYESFSYADIGPEIGCDCCAFLPAEQVLLMPGAKSSRVINRLTWEFRKID
jgi:hypothetical protein